MNDCSCVGVFFFRQAGRRGQRSVMQQSRGQEKNKKERKKGNDRQEMETRGSEGGCAQR